MEDDPSSCPRELPKIKNNDNAISISIKKIKFFLSHVKQELKKVGQGLLFN